MSTYTGQKLLPIKAVLLLSLVAWRLESSKLCDATD